MRSRIVVVLAVLLLAPLAAQAGKPKSPLYALVNAHGEPAVSSGLSSQRSLYDPVGVYRVTMNERPDIVGCVAVASSAGGFVALFDMPFYIVVHCPKWESSG